MKNKVFAIFLIFLLCLGIFAGCSRTPSPDSSNQSDQSDKSGGQGEQTSKPEDKPELTFWHYFSGANYEAFSELINQYNSLDTAKAVIAESYVPRDELSKKYALGVVSNELPDLAMIDNPDSAAYAAMGMFIDITDRFNAWDDNNFQPGPLESGRYNGRQYTLPIRSNCLGLWINDEMFAKAGIENLPTTWEELEAVCERLKEANPDVYPLAFSAIKNEEGAFQFLPFLLSAGADINSLNSEEGIKALTFIASLVQKNYVSPECINWSQNDVQKQFAAGNAAMMINGPWQIPNMKNDAPDLKYTVVYIPKDKKYSSSLGGENLGITKVCKDVEAGWDFVTWFLGTETNVKFNKGMGTISPHANVDPEELYPDDPVMKVFVEQLAYAAPRGPHPKWPEISSAIQEAIQQSITNYKSPEEAAREAAEKIAQINSSLQ